MHAVWYVDNDLPLKRSTSSVGPAIIGRRTFRAQIYLSNTREHDQHRKHTQCQHNQHSNNVHREECLQQSPEQGTTREMVNKANELNRTHDHIDREHFQRAMYTEP